MNIHFLPQRRHFVTITENTLSFAVQVKSNVSYELGYVKLLKLADLMEMEMAGHIFVKLTSIKVYENQLSRSRIVTYEQTGGQR
jgi:hypothetical protein